MYLNKQQRRLARTGIVIVLLLGLAAKSKIGNLTYWSLFILCGFVLNSLQNMAKKEKSAATGSTDDSAAPPKLTKEQLDKKKKQRFAYIFFGVLALGLISLVSEEGTDAFKVDMVKASSWDGSVAVVESFLKQSYLRDPSSYEGVKWGKLTKNADGTLDIIIKVSM